MWFRRRALDHVLWVLQPHQNGGGAYSRTMKSAQLKTQQEVLSILIALIQMVSMFPHSVRLCCSSSWEILDKAFHTSSLEVFRTQFKARDFQLALCGPVPRNTLPVSVCRTSYSFMLLIQAIKLCVFLFFKSETEGVGRWLSQMVQTRGGPEFRFLASAYKV